MLYIERLKIFNSKNSKEEQVGRLQTYAWKIFKGNVSFFFPNFQSRKMKIPFSIQCPLKIFNSGLFSSVMWNIYNVITLTLVFKCNVYICWSLFFLYMKKYTFVNTVCTKKSDSHDGFTVCWLHIQKGIQMKISLQESFSLSFSLEKCNVKTDCVKWHMVWIALWAAEKLSALETYKQIVMEINEDRCSKKRLLLMWSI